MGLFDKSDSDCPHLNKRYYSRGQMMIDLKDNKSNQNFEDFSLYPTSKKMELVTLKDNKARLFDWQFLKRDGSKYFYKDVFGTQWILDNNIISLTRVDGIHITFILSAK